VILNDPTRLPPKKDKETQKDLRIVKATIGAGHDIFQGHPDKAITRAIVSGIKLADGSPFRNQLANPLTLLAELQKIGIGAVGWEPETLMSVIDRKYHGWTEERLAAALEKFHTTGLIETDVDPLVRQKLYAIRVVSTSDTAHSEWHVFEKIGAAFNDRMPHFGIMEPLSAAECARTVALIENIRSDSYSNEIKIYIAAACQQDGLLTVEPIKALAQCQAHLDQMNKTELGEAVDEKEKALILAKYAELVQNHRKLTQVPDDMESVQALKLFAIQKMVEDVHA
jgi:hypothetical protein